MVAGGRLGVLGLACCGFVLGGYLLSAGRLIQGPSWAPHSLYLAHAFLHGQTHLVVPPPSLHDYVLREGRIYVSQQALPAVLMMPGVAIVGLRFSDVLFTLCFGVLNVFLMIRWLSRLGVARPAVLWLAALFAFGTPHWYLSVMGRVWHTATVCGLTFSLLGLNEMDGRRRLWLVGWWIGLACCCRPPMVGAFAYVMARVILAAKQDRWTRRAAMRAIAALCLPLTLIGIIWGGYNFARFSNPFETGFSYFDKGADISYAIRAEHGLLSVAYVLRNVWYAFLNPFQFAPTFPFIRPDPQGNGLFFVTPAFVYLARAVRQHHSIARAAWSGAIAVITILMVYFWTGWTQFGYRYLVDAVPFLLVLTARGMGAHLSGWAKGLIGLSMIINGIGMRWFLTHF